MIVFRCPGYLMISYLLGLFLTEIKVILFHEIIINYFKRDPTPNNVQKAKCTEGTSNI